jgi:hypothetical protein
MLKDARRVLGAKNLESNDTWSADREQSKARSHAWLQEALIVLTLLTATTALFFSDVVFSGKTILPLSVEGVVGWGGPYGYSGTVRDDPFRLDIVASTWQFEPLTLKVANELRAGQFPLWNEDQAFGMPLLADAVSGSLNPLHLPLLVNSSALSWDIFFLARVILAGLASYLFARVIGLSAPARMFFVFAFIFSGHFMLYSNNHWLEAYFLLPVILLGTELALGDHRRAGFTLTGLAVGLDLLVGMPEVTLGVLLFCAAYGAYRLLQLLLTTHNRREWFARAGLLVGGWLVGLALAAPLLIPMFEFVGHSSAAATRRQVFGLSHAPLADVAVWFMPFLKGFPLYLTIKPISTYVGATVIVLAAYSLVPQRTDLYRRFVPFTAAATALLLAKTYGVPGINELGRLPGLNVTVIPTWFSPITGFCLALLASIGVHHLSQARVKTVASLSVIVAVLTLGLVAVAANWSTIALNPPNEVSFTIGLALLCAVATWLTIQFVPRRFPWLAGTVCCMLVVGELFALAPRGIYQDRYDRFTAAPYISFLQKQQQSSEFRIFATDGYLFPNFASAFGLPDIRALNALYIDRYMAFIQSFVSPEATDRFTGIPYAPEAEKDALIADNPWFDLTGVRYVIVKPDSPTARTFGIPLVRPIYESESAIGHVHPDMRIAPVTIGGAMKHALFEAAPDKARFPLTIDPQTPELRFSLGTSPDAENLDKDAGVTFEIDVERDGKAEVVYRRKVDATSRQSDPQWINDSIDLSGYAGQDIFLAFVTRPIKAEAYAGAVWGDIRLTSLGTEASDQYATVYDDEVRILENSDVLPRALLVQDAVPVANLDEAIATMKRGDIDPRQTAVVEGAPTAEITALGTNTGTSDITTYTAQHVRVDVNVKSPSLLVLTDAVYPGWTATIDGQLAPIYATDAAFRGVFVPAGQHQVDFSYEPWSFRVGLVIAVFGAFGGLTVLCGLNPRRWLGRALDRGRS